jgi:diguanylate cyclase (GGDEF)-like protein
MLRAYAVLSACLLAAFAAHTALGVGGRPSELFDGAVYNALILLAAGGVAARGLIRSSERAVWLVLAAGMFSSAAGELTYTYGYGGEPPFPSVADVLYLGFYPCAYVALILLVRSRLSNPNRSVWLDGITVVLAAAALGAAVLVDAVLTTTHGSMAAAATNLAYPLGDIVLLSLVVGVFALTGWRPGPAWTAIGVGLIATAVADGIYLYQSTVGTYREGHFVDTLWPASFLLLAAAAWQPVRRADVELAGRPLMATPAACGVIGLVLLVHDHYHPLNELALWLAAATVAAVIVRTGLTFVENARILAATRELAVTDPLTDLGNRRKLLVDLERALEGGAHRLLIVFDLDGFKLYNDTFGHPAGDALLRRLGRKLAAVVDSWGSSYRLGGDEFCVLADVPPDEAHPFMAATAEALSDEGEGFVVRSSFGALYLPDEAADARSALRLADERLYAQKHSAKLGRGQPHEVLLQALYEREPELRAHVRRVAALSVAIGSRLGLDPDELDELRRAAEMHDVGKLAIPDTVLHKPGPLDDAEWEFVRQHTVIGQRILGAAPALHAIGKIVRSTHERWDGSGYADGLVAEEIPLAARIIAVCDAFTAMTADRPYRVALSDEDAVREVRRCAGTQFDPVIAEVFCELAEERPDALRAA